MKRIDFLSNSPRTFIFEKNANKTSIGGFLTIIYLVILVILAFAYIYNYEVNMKYVISYGFYQTEKTEDEKSKLRDDPSYNPTLTFEFDVEDMLGNSLSDNYVLLDFTSGNLIKRNEPIEFNVSNLYIIVLYNCSDMSCPIQPEDVFAYQGYYMRITVKRSYFKFDLQDKEEPVKKTKMFGLIIYLILIFLRH